MSDTATEFPPPVAVAGGLEPGETQVVVIPTPDDITEEDRRNLLDGLPGIPLDEPVGWLDASVDASTQAAQVLIDSRVDLALDTFVVSPQRLVDGTVLFHYGIVTEAAGRVEGTTATTDTERFANLIQPGQRFRWAEVTWIRTHPEVYLPPASGAKVWIAAGEHRRRALFLDKMESGEEIPIGLDMNDEIVFIPYSFLNGERGAHASISGKSGVATKTSYALFLLYVLFETHWGLKARKGSPHDRALVFSVKGADLCLLDKHNNVFVDTDPRGEEAKAQWARLGIDDPRPFENVAVYAPAEDAPPGAEPVPDIEVRDKRSTHAYGWTPLELIRQGLLEYLFDDLESGQLSFVEQVVRTQLLRYAHPLAGDTTGRVVLADPPSTLGRSWEAASRAFSKKQPLNPADGRVVETLDELVEFVAGKVTDGDPDFDPAWTGQVTGATAQAFVRRLWKATPRLRRLIRAGLTPSRPGEAGVGGRRPRAPRRRAAFRRRRRAGSRVVRARGLDRGGAHVRRARRAQQVRAPPAGLTDQVAAGRHRGAGAQPRSRPHRCAAEPVRCRPRHHQQCRARSRRPDQVE